jgi:DNA gyrase/topoisomerase IV subunit A
MKSNHGAAAPAEKTLAAIFEGTAKSRRRFAFRDIQAQAILDLQLRRLSALERQKIIDELARL